MWIKDIELFNFRNYEKERFEFISGINVLYGLNGQGKTNLIEAINYLSTLNSFRNSKNDDVIKNKENVAVIRSNTSENMNIKISLLKTKKNIIVDNEEVKKLRDYIGKVNVISFGSEDIVNFKDSPHERRKFFDIELSKIDKNYSTNLIRFKKMIKQRNEVLKKKSKHIKEYLEVLDKQIIEVSKLIYLKRKWFVEKINELLNQELYVLTNVNYDSKLILKSDFENLNDSDIKKIFENNLEKDLEKGTTLFGIHKDDYQILLDNLDLVDKSSSGQQRITLLAIKMVILKLTEELINKTPILILDDVFSELDEEKKKMLLKRVESVNQIFITTTSIKELEVIERECKYFEIKQGIKVKERMNLNGRE